MYEVSWSARGETPDHTPHVFPDYLAALKFLQDEVDWYHNDVPEDLTWDYRQAVLSLETAKDGDTIAFSIGRYAFWLLPLVDS